LAATKEALHMEIQTLESKNNRLSEEKKFLVSVLLFFPESLRMFIIAEYF